jgi:hypothetical protein
VSAKGVEIGIERLDVERKMRRTLRPVHEHDRTGRVRAGDDGLQRRDGSQRIAHVRDRDELAAVEQPVEVVENVDAASVDRNET